VCVITAEKRDTSIQKCPKYLADIASGKIKQNNIRDNTRTGSRTPGNGGKQKFNKKYKNSPKFKTLMAAFQAWSTDDNDDNKNEDEEQVEAPQDNTADKDDDEEAFVFFSALASLKNRLWDLWFSHKPNLLSNPKHHMVGLLHSLQFISRPPCFQYYHKWNTVGHILLYGWIQVKKGTHQVDQKKCTVTIQAPYQVQRSLSITPPTATPIDSPTHSKEIRQLRVATSTFSRCILSQFRESHDPSYIIKYLSSDMNVVKMVPKSNQGQVNVDLRRALISSIEYPLCFSNSKMDSKVIVDTGASFGLVHTEPISQRMLQAI